MPNTGRTTIQAMATTTSEIAPASTKEISPVPMPMMLPMKGTTLPRMLSGRIRGHESKAHQQKSADSGQPRDECVRAGGTFKHRFSADAA